MGEHSAICRSPDRRRLHSALLKLKRVAVEIETGEGVWEESGGGCLSSSDGRLSVSDRRWVLNCVHWDHLPLAVYLMNCAYNYQTWGQQHYSAAPGPHLRTPSLTQLLAVFNRRRRQARDPAGVTPEVLVLCCRGNVPHLHRRVAAKRERGGGRENAGSKSGVIASETCQRKTS